MFAYFLILALLVAAAFASLYWVEYRERLIIAITVILTCFAGMRFETGYDWPVYQKIFDATPTLLGLFKGEQATGLAVEPFYTIFLAALKSIGLGLQSSFLLVALLCIPTVVFVIYSISASATLPAVVVYFGLIFLPAHMSVERQSIAAALVLWSLLNRCRDRPITSAALFLAALGFHVYSLVFLPVIVLAKRPMAWRLVSSFVCVGLIIWFSKIDVLSPIAETARTMNVVGLAAKLKEYVSPADYSLLNVIFTLVELTILMMFYFATTSREEYNRFFRAGFWLTSLVVLAQLYLPGHPIFWKRILMVALPWQIAVLWQLQIFQRQKLSLKLGVTAFAALTSATVLFLYLRNPPSAVFLPYNSTWLVALTGGRGDGFDRWQRMINELPAQ